MTPTQVRAHPRVPLSPCPRVHVSREGYALGFFLFLLVNAALFVRPADVVPALVGLEIYQWVILSCLAVSFPAVLGSLSPARLEKRPIDLCVLLLLPLVPLSLVPLGKPADLWEGSFTFFKIVVYYLLFVSLVTTSARLRVLTGCLVVFSACTVVVSALDFHKVITLPPIVLAGKVVERDPTRLYGPGIFSDPNDMCVLLVTALVLLLGRLDDRQAGSRRWLWLIPIPIFAYGFILTQSRGGLLALLAGMGLYIRLRWGWRRAVFLGALGLPVLLAMLGARQTAISSSTDTARERIYLWNEGLVMFRDSPVFGIGWDHFSDTAGHVAHNSYMQAFSELGFAGGCLFLGAAFLSVWGLYRLALPGRGPRLRPIPTEIVDPQLRQLYPAVGGAVAAYAMGMVTLSLNGIVVTYAMFGLASVYIALSWRQTSRSAGEAGQTGRSAPTIREPLHFDLLLPLRFAVLGVLFLAAMFLFIRLFMRV